jgi:hypothetical protein
MWGRARPGHTGNLPPRHPFAPKLRVAGRDYLREDKTMKLAKLCYKRHDKRQDPELRNRLGDPHVHVPYTDERGRITKIIWEDVYKNGKGK